MEPLTYFIDESGHSGDLASVKALDFANQPVFALACIGVADEKALAEEMERLRIIHRCGPGELKSDMARLPHFVADLVAYLEARDSPIFIELVDKRFFIAIHIVNHLLCGGLGVDRVPMPERNAVAEFLTDQSSDRILLDYIAVCRDPSVEALRGLLQVLWAWLDESDEDVARVAQFLTMEARDRLDLGETPLESFLPLPDRTETDRMVWMLPNLTCLTNIYARINLSRPEGVGGITLVHDEQLQYGAVLESNKALVDDLAQQGNAPQALFANYDLSGVADLRFAASKSEICLQAADLLAGCAMRFARGATTKRRKKDSALRDAFFALLGLTDAGRGRGINLVFTYAALEKMGVPVFRPPPWLDVDG
ncbi:MULTISPECIES: DUF3800 domain-containing protein [unclassified Novosphingobium]|uniref:DUF3800 domain-containing protein n=1 Tax=unclassified Novosphingobium TaxID=2644732 RepID=UPI0017C071E2|nr:MULTISPECIES: DUF3800 domain-containing protein [unclassified Novosphingobium]NMN03799.1 cobalamin biosynthesis Mg chelatase CobN [Novosphingobium sp. SG919]